MSAGDVLKIALLEVMAPSKARDMVHAYAHELADKQRAYEIEVGLQPGYLPDLIDPEVEK